MKQKVFCFVRQNLNYGGASKIMIWLYNCLRRNNIDAYILILENNKTNTHFIDPERIISLNYKSSGNYVMRNIICFYDKYKLISGFLQNKQVTDVINFGDSLFDFLLIYKHFHKINLTISERVDPYYNRNIISKIRRSLFSFADKIVFQTYGARDYYSDNIKEKSIVIPNPVIINKSVPKWNGINSKEIIYIGRLDNYQKRLDLLVDAFSIVHQQYNSYILSIYGDGPDKNWLEAYIQERGLNNCIKLKGVTTCTYDIISNSKMLILTSDFEGIPNILIEALQVGIPIISTDCSPGGARLLISDLENGCLVERGNITAISEKIMYLLNNIKLQNKLSFNAPKSIERFSESRIENMWLNYLT